MWAGALKSLEVLHLTVDRGTLLVGGWTRSLTRLRSLDLTGHPIAWSPEAVLPAPVTRLILLDSLGTSLPAQARRTPSGQSAGVQ